MNVGDKAPEILGLNEKGEEIRLSNYKGKKIVLYFYPKDSTSGWHGHGHAGLRHRPCGRGQCHAEN